MRTGLLEPPARRSLLLVALGLGITAIFLVNFTLPFDLFKFYATQHLDVGKMTGHTAAWAYRFTIGFIALFALYLAAWYVARGPLNVWGKLAIAGFGAVFQGVLLLAYPMGSLDVFDYLANVRVLTAHDGNPLVQPPLTFPDDPFVRYTAWPFLKSAYGPLWTIVSAPAGYLSETRGLLAALLFYKGLAALLALGCGVLLHQILRRLDAPRPWAGTLLFLWNPLVVFEFGGNAHNDALLVFFLLLAVLLLVTRAIEGSFMALSAASLTKFVTAPLFAPLCLAVLFGPGLVRRRLAVTGVGLVLAAALAWTVYAPFWEGKETLGFLQQTDLFSSSPPALVARWLEGPWGWEWARAAEWTRRASLVAFATGSLAVIALLARGGHRAFIVTAYELLFLALAVGITWWRPWYVIWLLAMAPLTLDRLREGRAMLLTFTAFCSYTAGLFVWVLNAPAMNTPFKAEVVFTSTVWLPVLVWAALEHWPGQRVAVPAMQPVPVPGGGSSE